MTRKSFQSAASSLPADPVVFDVDGETFAAVPVLSATAATTLAVLGSSEDSRERMTAIGEFLDLVLVPESRERFATRMAATDKPLTLDDVSEVVTWLIEDVYVLRPTGPPSL